MGDFLKAWAREARTWYIVALVTLLWTSVVFLAAHGLAWLGDTYGPAAVFGLLLATALVVITGGSGYVTYRRHRANAGTEYPPEHR